jgi:hypothetical protein
MSGGWEDGRRRRLGESSYGFKISSSDRPRTQSLDLGFLLYRILILPESHQAIPAIMEGYNTDYSWTNPDTLPLFQQWLDFGEAPRLKVESAMYDLDSVRS